MNTKTRKITAAALAGLMALFIAPISAFAGSTGSTADNTSIGEDKVQNAKTTYAEVKEGNAQTKVYLTIDDGDLVVSVPTTVILSGTPDASGKYSAGYTIGVSGDMSGNKTATVKPEGNSVTLHQTGKADKAGTVTQAKTSFDTNDFKSKATTTGTVESTGLTAGSWSGQFNFVLATTNA